jgi:hypothetical protein
MATIFRYRQAIASDFIAPHKDTMLCYTSQISLFIIDGSIENKIN